MNRRAFVAGAVAAAVPSCGKAKKNVFRVAVASNFAPTLRKLVAAAGFDCELVVGSSGSLLAQILAGAPFAAFVTANENDYRVVDRKRTAVDAFSFAIAFAAFWAPDRPEWLADPAAMPSTERVALANPAHAPFGQVGDQFLVKNTVGAERIIAGSVAQAYRHVVEGNAAAGVVAVAHLKQNGVAADEFVLLKEDLTLTAILLGGRKVDQAKFAALLRSDEAVVIMREDSYGCS